MTWILVIHKLIMGLPWWAQVAFLIIAFPLSVYALFVGFIAGFTLRFLMEDTFNALDDVEDSERLVAEQEK